MNTYPQQPTNDLRIDTAWRENFSGASMNRKLHGLLSTGVYAGFKVKPKSGLAVEISAPEESIAVLEVGSYSLTARMPANIKKQLTLIAGKTQYVVLEAQYALHQASTVGMFVRDAVPANAIMLAKVTLPAGATSITASQIERALPSKPVTAADYAELAAYTIDNGRRTLELQQELNKIKKHLGI
ncbi:hypothetical protein PL84_02520 [Vibrio anguillarum]|uniref:hypothetical protein n=2 Tax=Vibrio anguillarum TaxID=55601 RepID=UPI00097E1D72|nr:hypothetical protein [Vibrio anguillarum]MBT2909451.1 hypothetical protein [Vibrio anguillarum]MBT2942523.1 hypothetical protein [Vibrio anguillarum]MBT2950653.1 hypothetical protein [Vibrio anguillarum]